MILVSRAAGQSIVLQELFLLTVIAINNTDIHIHLSEKIRGRLTSFEQGVDSILPLHDVIPLSHGASLSLHAIRKNKAILAFNGLAANELHRKEAYDTLHGLTD
jgi:hypothetical protein